MLLTTPNFTTLVVSLLCFTSTAVNAVPSLEPRQIPANATDVTTIKSPTGVTIRYKEPGKAGVCETTPGVGSYSGYVDLSPTSHTFFWFFEARHNPETAPLTLWLNGGPGSDSLIGLFQGAHNSNGEYFDDDMLNKVHRTRTLQCHPESHHRREREFMERSIELTIHFATTRSGLLLL